MNVHQSKVRATKMAQNTLAIRKKLWPTLQEAELWNRKTETGFTTIPRVMPLIIRILDDLSKGKPLGYTYLSLWCRVWDEGVVQVSNPTELAFESGFTGERAASTWIARMRTLRDLGFIRTSGASGTQGEFQYVLLLNPLPVLKKLDQGGQIQLTTAVALLQRANEVGAKGFDE